jgi:Fe-S cluster assembly iron-binding protein IscA
MLQLTPEATRHLLKIRGERGVDERAGARFVSKGGRVGLTFALAPVAGDRVLNNAEIKVFVAPEIAETLGESIIDARDEDGQTALIMRKQAASRTKAANSTN